MAVTEVDLGKVVGPAGPAGTTPVKGVDYFTDAELAEITAQAAESVDLSTKQDKITTTGILKGSGNGNVVSAVSGTDYATPAQVDAKQNKISATGLLKGNGNGSISAAVSGTDYATPAQVNAKQDKILSNGILRGTNGSISSAVSGVDYVMPYKAGNSFTMRLRGGGYITGTNSVYFYIPFSQPLYGMPTITITSVSNWVIRSNGQYAFGGTEVQPTSIVAYQQNANGTCAYATFSSATNAQNNAACGIDININVRFS